MTPERWHKIGEIFAAVMEAEGDNRTEMLSRLCGTDVALRAEVESMISAQHQLGDFLESPPQEELPTDLGTASTPTDSGDRSEPPEFLAPEGVQLGRGLSIAERYVVERELGRGGIGVVYLARDSHLHARLVVVKVLLDSSSASKWTYKKFLHESEALTRIDHPNIVKVFDRGTLADGRNFIVMEYIAGNTLREEIKIGPLPFSRAARIIEQMGRALTAAHGAGVYHRDLKPENVMLRSSGDGADEVKVIDFGIAKVTDPVSTKVTLENVYAGTLHYMAPEQMEDVPCTSAVDVYAMGVIAYEMLTGQRPFHLTTQNLPLAFRQLMEQQRNGLQKGPRELRPDMAPAVEAVILRALRYNPSERYQSARQFSEHLAKALRGSADDDPQIETVPSIPPWSESPPPTIVAGSALAPKRKNYLWALAALPVLAVGIWFLTGRPGTSATAPPATPPVQPPRPVAEASVVMVDVNLLKFRSPQGSLSEFVLPDSEFTKDERFRFRFTPRQTGFLYLLASTDRNRHTLLLTGTPTLENRATANTVFLFPNRPDTFLGVRGTAPVTTFRVIFSPAPLAIPGFLAGEAGIELTDEQEIEFQRLWQTLPAAEPVTDLKGVRPALRYQSSKPDDRAVRFEIVIRNPAGK